METKQEKYQKHLEWRRRNQDKIREYNRKHYQKNKEKINAQRKRKKQSSHQGELFIFSNQKVSKYTPKKMSLHKDNIPDESLEDDWLENSDDDFEIIINDDAVEEPKSHKALLSEKSGLEAFEMRSPPIAAKITEQGYSFMKFESVKHLRQYHENLPFEERCMYEVFYDDWPMKLCIDFDQCVSDDEIDEQEFVELLETIITPINSTINRLYGLVEYPASRTHWTIATSCGWSKKNNSMKLSAHLVLHQWAFPSVYDIKYVVEQSKAYIPKEVCQSIDMTVLQSRPNATCW